MKEVRVRFAPSPTGGLHIGGLRTALFNYLYAKKNNGKFILRIEDTDQARFVEGAEDYISEALSWCGIEPDESPVKGGEYAPYKQSERKEIYKKFVDKLLNDGFAYYAFDTPEELELMRETLKNEGVINLNYNSASRMIMKNSLTLSNEETKKMLEEGVPYVVRLKIPPKEEVRFKDLIRGWVKFHTSTLDDKVIMKSDGLPTYHLANVVDDYLMKISHVIRGEEWLPSTPLHVLLYKFLGIEDKMPEFAHLPLLLKPDGNGKLSKRSAEVGGFPIFPLTWKDPNTQEVSVGFREKGFLPEAMVNFLVLLGWNPGNNQEIFTLDELANIFSIDRIGKSGTKFDIEKAKWFNQYYLSKKQPDEIAQLLNESLLKLKNIHCNKEKAIKIAMLLIDRVVTIAEMVELSDVFFEIPQEYDEKVISKKLNEQTILGLKIIVSNINKCQPFEANAIQTFCTDILLEKDIKFSSILQILRVALTGKGMGFDLMQIIEILGVEEVVLRINTFFKKLNID